MISRTRGIFSGNIWKPKNIHSVEYLKYLYNVLNKNQNISEQNRDLLVEVIRLIAEILIWGDQNDSAVIDFFLEKNILAFFLKLMRHKNGKLICNQLLQTLSIMFENISDNTSIYYLLSNNHINSIICHKFDFSDEEVMAYYISFLKALSMKLNKHTINFFYNEHTDDFALYTEAIKFFNQTESMVRTAVRVITLNVYKVADKPMLRYIRNKTAGPYFRSLVWSIGTQVLDIDSCLRNDSNQNIDCKLQSFIDEHLDNLHYINDILCLNVDLLNDILIDCLMNKLIIPLYIYSLTKHRPYSPDTDEKPHITYSLSLFLLSQIFIIIKQPNIVEPLAEIILRGDLSYCTINDKDFDVSLADDKSDYQNPVVEKQKSVDSTTSETATVVNHVKMRSPISERRFETSMESLGQLLDNIKGNPRPRSNEFKSKTLEDQDPQEKTKLTKSAFVNSKMNINHQSAPVTPRHRISSDKLDDSRDIMQTSLCNNSKCDTTQYFNQKSITHKFSLEGKPFLKTIFRCLTVDDETLNSSLSSNNPSLTTDYDILFSLCLLFTMCQNQGVNEKLLTSVGLTSKAKIKQMYNRSLLDKFFIIFNYAVKYDSPIRLVTLELMCLLVEILVCSREESFISDEHFAFVLTAREESTLLLRNYYKSEGIFVDMFEEEYLNLQKRPLNVEFLIMDSRILLPVSSNLLNSVDFTKRLPNNDIEHARYAIRVFLLLKQLCDKIKTSDESNNIDNDDVICDNDEVGRLDNISNICNNSVAPHDNNGAVSRSTDNKDGKIRNSFGSSSNSISALYPFNINIFSIGDKLDLTNRDLVACTLEKNGRTDRRFLVIDDQQIILVEPDSKKVGWGVIIFVGFLQHVKIAPIREDKKSLLIKVYDHKGSVALKTGNTGANVVGSSTAIVPILSAKFTFDDHIRCMVAHKRLEKGRDKAQENKLRQIALLLDFPTNVALSIKPSANNNNEYRSGYYGPKEPVSPQPHTSVVVDKSPATSSESSDSFNIQIICNDSTDSHNDI